MGFLNRFIIAIMVVLLFITAGSMIFSNVVSNYGLANGTGNVSNRFAATNQMYELSEDMKVQSLGAEVSGGDESWESLVKGSYSSVRLVSRSYNVTGTMLDAAIEAVGLDEGLVDVFKAIALTIIMVSIFFAVIYLVFRFKG